MPRVVSHGGALDSRIIARKKHMKKALQIPQIKKLSLRVFLIILMCLLLPFFLLVRYVRSDMENTLRGEISERIVQNFSKSTTEVERVFTRMASISTILYTDEALVSVFADSSSTDYDRKQAYNRVLRQIYSQDLYEYTSEYTGGINVMLRDKAGRLFFSWPAADADSLQRMWEAPFVANCQQKPGFIFWDMDAPPIVLADGSEHRQIALARAIVDLSVLSRSYGTMIVTVDQDRIFQILNEYRYCDDDVVFATLGNGGELGTSEEVANYIMEHAKIMVNQGTPYGAQGAGYLRIVTACFAKDEDAVLRFTRIKDALTQLAKEKGIV